jgi:hypothetical protein
MYLVGMDGGTEMIKTLPSGNHLGARREKRIPASGNSALAASALIQGALGIEFTLSGLNKVFDANYISEFGNFVRFSPAATAGFLSPFINALVIPNLSLFAHLVEFSELGLGIVLIVGALEVARRRFGGRFGAEHGYEAPVAFVAAAAGLGTAGLALSIFLLTGGVLPTVMPGRAFTTAIPVELLLVPLGLAVAWVEFGRFRVLSR